MPTLSVLTPDRFGDRAWKRPHGYAFAASVHVVPVAAVELSRLVPELPLAFIEADSGYQLVAVLSLRPGANAFVGPDARWLGGYVPAVLRAYPFRLARSEGRADSVLCIDEDSGLIGAAGDGEPFFDADGRPAEAIRQIFELLAQTQQSGQATERAVAALDAAALIQPWKLQLQADERRVAVEGLARVDEAALNALPDTAWLSLRHAGALPVAYGQLLAMEGLRTIHTAEATQARLRASGQERAQDLGLRLDEDTNSFHW